MLVVVAVVTLMAPVETQLAALVVVGKVVKQALGLDQVQPTLAVAAAVLGVLGVLGVLAVLA